MTVNDAISYFDRVGFSDFKHTTTQVSLIKAQHPDFETWSQGIHASGVTCADCHMSYLREGAAKISDHQIASPLRSEATINQSCTCHHSSAAEMQQRVDTIQQRWDDAKNVSFTAVQALIDDLTAAVADGKATRNSWPRPANSSARRSISSTTRCPRTRAASTRRRTRFRSLNQATDYARSGQLVLRGVDVDNARGPETYDIQPVEPPAR